jgi:branched-chain amino acid transport system ATP-binding protein
VAALLELEHVDAGYGPFRALFDVSFAVEEGSATALLGSNGAGKTTVARVCSGLVSPTAGSVRFADVDVTGAPAWRVARLGLEHAPEGRSVFASLTVEENLALALPSADLVDLALDRFPRLAERRRQAAGSLSGGEQRMLSLARVLAGKPRLLVADELSLGLSPAIVDEVYRSLATIREAGTALLVVEQQVTRALALADDAVLLSKGRVVYAGPVSEMGTLAEQLLPVED